MKKANQLLISAIFVYGLLSSCTKKDPVDPPVLSTLAVTEITSNSAKSGGNITDDGGATIISKGIVWGLTPTPSIEQHSGITVDGSGVGVYISNLLNLTPNTTYYVRAYATNSLGTSYGNQVSFVTNHVVPNITTNAITNISTISATGGGIVNSDGGASVIEQGVCWSTNQNPTISNNKTTEPIGEGPFISSITGLSPNTTYFIRAYATNSAGTGYGNQLSFTSLNYLTDIDGNYYNIIAIGTQIWMKENLKTTKFSDGTLIPLVTDYTTWGSLTSPGYCWYNNDAATYKATYGALYNWYAASATFNGNKNICPTGWHLPSDSEWTTMENYLITNGYNYDGTTTGNKIAKALSAKTNWTSSTTLGSIGNTDYPAKRNATGFTAVPGGARGTASGVFGNIGYYGIWWSATLGGANDAWGRVLVTNYTDLYRGGYHHSLGHSIRCVKD